MSFYFEEETDSFEELRIQTIAEARAQLIKSAPSSSIGRKHELPPRQSSTPSLPVPPKKEPMRSGQIVTAKPKAKPKPVAKELSGAALRAKRMSHSISEFAVKTKPFSFVSATATVAEKKDPVVVVQVAAAPVTPVEASIEQRFAEATLSQRSFPAPDNHSCGNSPFCTDEKHRHDQDQTSHGKFEQRVRTSAWVGERKELCVESVSQVPVYPSGEYAASGASKETHKHEMSAADFMEGVKSGDLATHVLALMRIYCAELKNIERTTAEQMEEIEACRKRQQTEAGDGAELESVNRHALLKKMQLPSEAADKMRILDLTTSEQLSALLRRHKVPRYFVVQASLFRLVVSRSTTYAEESEYAILERVNDAISRADDEGPLVVPADATTSFNEDNAKSESGRRASPPPVYFGEGSKRRRSSAGQDSTVESLFVSSGSENVQDERVLAVCPSQFFFAAGCTACTSICVNVASTLVQARHTSASSGMSELVYIERGVDWNMLVENGVTWWKEASREPEHTMEVLGADQRGIAIRSAFNIFEHAGSLFDEKRDPLNEEDRLSLMANPDLESALEMCEKEAKTARFACVVTFHGHSIALSSHAHGWHVFDSAGSTILGMSVLFSLPTRREAIDVVRRLFNVNDLDPDIHSGGTLDEHRTYSLLCLTLK